VTADIPVGLIMYTVDDGPGAELVELGEHPVVHGSHVGAVEQGLGRGERRWITTEARP
jgi:hypothetical protein